MTIQEEIQRHRRNIERETARKIAAQGNLRKFFTREGVRVFSGQSSANRVPNAQIKSANRNIARSLKIIRELESQLSQVSTQTSAFEVGSTIGSASSQGLSIQAAPPIGQTFQLTKGTFSFQNNILMGNTIARAHSDATFGTRPTPFNFQTNITLGSSIIASDSQELLFTEARRAQTSSVNFTLNDAAVKVNQQMFIGGTAVSNKIEFVIVNTSPSVLKSTSFEIRFTDLPNENFSTNTSRADLTRIEQEAQIDSRWSTFFLADVEIAPSFTFQQIITRIDAILAKPPPVDGCNAGFHRDPNTGFCVPDDPPIEEERDLFQTAIVGAIGIGLLASLMGGKKK